MLRFIAMRRLIFTVVLALAALAGCDDHHHRHHRNDPDVDKEPGAFFYRVDADDFTETRVYSWDTFHDEVFVTFEAFDFRGQFGVKVVDDHGVTIYDRTFIGTGERHEFHVDDTANGDEGDWQITFTAVDADGDLFVTLD